jgi:hypothetical protein
MYSRLTNCEFYRTGAYTWQGNEVPSQIGGCFNSREQRGVYFQKTP